MSVTENQRLATEIDNQRATYARERQRHAEEIERLKTQLEDERKRVIEVGCFATSELARLKAENSLLSSENGRLWSEHFDRALAPEPGCPAPEPSPFSENANAEMPFLPPSRP